MKGPFPISKYKVYLSEANSLEEAQSMAPDDAEVQQGDQGGFYYDKDPEDSTTESDSGGEEEADGVEEESFDYDGYEVREFGDAIGVDLQDYGVSEGDLLYVEHPDGNYIAEVDAVEAGWSSWRVDFGGSFHLDESTTSQPVGLVEDVPELAPNQELRDGWDMGDIVAWEDDGGFRHFGRVENTSASGTMVRVDSGELVSVDDIEGHVVDTGPPDPHEEYELPGSDDAEPEQVEFNQNLAEAIIDGDATSIPAYKFMSYAGSIEDPDLAVDAYQSILQNDGNKTQRERMERRLRGMGVDPGEHQDIEVAPDEVPSVRQNTVYANFTSGRAIEVATAFATTSRNDNWETWNDFMDHLTQDELKTALERAGEASHYGVNSYQGPLAFEHSDVNLDGSKAPERNLGAILSRIEDDGFEAAKSAAESAVDENTGDIIRRNAVMFLKSADDRRKAADEFGTGKKTWNQVQFSSMPSEERVQRMAKIHTANTTSSSPISQRAAMLGYSGEDDDMVNGYNNKTSIAPIEPTDEVVEAIEWNQSSAITNAIEEGVDTNGYNLVRSMRDNLNDDGTITLWRGVKEKVTGHTSVESWSTNRTTAENFDGAGILEVKARPEDVMVANDVNHTYHSGEEEWTLLGGQIAGRAKAIQGDPIELMLKGFDLDEEDFVIAPNSEWVEAAIFDDIFDPGMGPRMEAAREQAGDSESDSGGGGKGIEQLATEIAERASQRLSEKEGVSSATSGTGQATYGGARDTTEQHPDDEEEEEDVEKADPMANGHDLDPETGEGICSQTGKTIEAETMGDLTQDCPHCGDPLSVLSEKSDTLEKPQEVEDCVDSVLDDNPDMDESTAYAICYDQRSKSAEREHIDRVAEAPEDVVVHVDEDDNLYYEKMWKSDDADWLAKTDASFEEIDDTFLEAHESIVQWNLSGDEPMEKAPRMFEGSDRVPEFVKNFIREAFDKGAFWTRNFENVPGHQVERLKQVFKDSLTQPQGWSLSSIIENIQEEFPGVDTEDAELIARNETAALTNTAREQAYTKRGDGDEKYYWTGPEDHRTTDICHDLKQMTQPKRGGSPVPLEDLKKALMAKAKEHRGRGGTPGRVDEWVPHYQCRHTFVRDVHL